MLKQDGVLINYPIGMLYYPSLLFMWGLGGLIDVYTQNILCIRPNIEKITTKLYPTYFSYSFILFS